VVLPDSGVPTEHAATSFVWRDIVVLCDDGRTRISEYAGLLSTAQEVQRKYPSGFGVLIVVPRNSVPPRDEARRAINDVMARVAEDIRCMCWLIEGSGFEAAMARAVLTGMRFVSHTPYARHVSLDLSHALTWMLSLLAHGKPRLGEVELASTFIAQRLAAIRPSGVTPSL
jgi:hypothetical protein